MLHFLLQRVFVREVFERCLRVVEPRGNSLVRCLVVSPEMDTLVETVLHVSETAGVLSKLVPEVNNCIKQKIHVHSKLNSFLDSAGKKYFHSIIHYWFFLEIKPNNYFVIRKFESAIRTQINIIKNTNIRAKYFYISITNNC